MDDNGSQSSPANNGGVANGGEGGGGSGAPAQRPEYIAEKYWDSAAGQPRIEAMAAGIKELETRLGKGKEAFKAEYDAERFKSRPAKPEDYKFALPEAGPVAERFGKMNLVLLDKEPGDDFKPEQGKQYFVMDQNSPLLGFWRQHAHATGLSNDDFMAGVAAFAEAEISKTAKSSEAIRAEIDGEMKKLGEHGRERAKFAHDRLSALLGEDKAKPFDFIKVDAAATEAVEALLEKLGEPKFSPGQGGASASNADEDLAEARKLQADPDYWQSPEKQKKVAAAFARAYPGQANIQQPSFARG